MSVISSFQWLFHRLKIKQVLYQGQRVWQLLEMSFNFLYILTKAHSLQLKIYFRFNSKCHYLAVILHSREWLK